MVMLRRGSSSIALKVGFRFAQLAFQTVIPAITNWMMLAMMDC